MVRVPGVTRAARLMSSGHGSSMFSFPLIWGFSFVTRGRDRLTEGGRMRGLYLLRFFAEVKIERKTRKENERSNDEYQILVWCLERHKLQV